jgi:trk/ktr system potassium uptake protein
MLVFSFLAIIIFGAFLLWLPLSQSDLHDPISFLDAFFTSTSATCVTGLVVCDTGINFSLFGQLVLLFLIQVGGLGILSFTTFIFFAATGRLRLSDRFLLEQTHGLNPVIQPRQLLRYIFIYTFSIEAVGAVFLTSRFMMDFSFPKALCLGVFSSVSAFCNAGFSLFSDSLVTYQDDLLVNIVMMALIILGGLGFLVAGDLYRYIKMRREATRRLTLHSKIVLYTSFWLLVGGTLVFCIFEWNGTQGGDNIGQYLCRMAFLSTSARTAGFNTVGIGELTNSSLVIMLILMAIGASPGSTGGGLKTTTIAVIASLFYSQFRSRPKAEIFKRSISSETVTKALASLAGFLLCTLIALLCLEFTELSGLPHSQIRGNFFAHLFEVVSALATVGLSTGVTASLTGGGKVVIIICMFIGRLGPVVLGASLIGRKPTIPYTFPEEPVMIS